MRVKTTLRAASDRADRIEVPYTTLGCGKSAVESQRLIAFLDRLTDAVGEDEVHADSVSCADH
jgi:hypothetical protein